MIPIWCKYLTYYMFKVYTIIWKLKIKFIYLKNYLDLSREEKFDCFKLLGNADNLNVSHQRVVFGENTRL